MRKMLAVACLGTSVIAGPAWGASVHVTMHRVDGNGVTDIIGLIEFQDTPKGLKIMPNLSGLSEGQHGIHVHENPSCDPMEKDGAKVPALAAGGHFDPRNTGRHEGPAGQGHLGDLPVLYVGPAGKATRDMWAPRLTTGDLTGRAIVVHAGGDNYSDSPAQLGGGGARVACGVVIR